MKTINRKEDADVKEKISWQEAGYLAAEAVRPVTTERVPLEDCSGRILAEDMAADADVPAFDRSPYDGYAFRAEDIREASESHPVTLRIIEEIAAGETAEHPVTEGTAVRLMTGAPVPPGADAVQMFEKTIFTETEVTFSAPVPSGSNIIRAGEDIQKGDLLAVKGTRIDAGLAGMLAGQNRICPEVFKRPLAGVLSTGSELLETGSRPEKGKIYDTNRYTLSAELEKNGCNVRYCGIAKDDPESIGERLREALADCDILFLTGGVSVGKYDYTKEAMEQIGAKILFHGAAIKPGMACTYGIYRGKLIAGLSGNPASSLTNFHVIAAPAVRRLCGVGSWQPVFFPVVLRSAFRKKSVYTRFLRGKLDLSEGTAGIRLSPDQGNVILRSAAGSDLMAVVPAGSGPLEEGTVLQGFLL